MTQDPTYTLTTICRGCGSRALEESVLDLGSRFISDFPADLDTRRRAPLVLLECGVCGLVQLSATVDPQILYGGQYWYASGINGTMREELRAIVRQTRQLLPSPLRDGDVVMDVGANDGTLLKAWVDHLWEGKPWRIAVDASPSFTEAQKGSYEESLQGFFPHVTLQVESHSVRALSTIAMFYDLEDPRAGVAEIRRLLRPDGIWVAQFQDLAQMLAATAVDNVCHEHLFYPSLHTFRYLVESEGLRVFHAEKTPINGGSLRVYVTPDPNRPPTPELLEALVEDGRGVNSEAWDAFKGRLHQRLGALEQTVAAAQLNGHVVDLLGASTKGNTLLQLATLGPAEIRQAWERHPQKIGRYTITGIPIVDESYGRGLSLGPDGQALSPAPDLLICPIWQFREALIEREHQYLRSGGRIYFPLPLGDLYMGGAGAF